MGWAKIDTSWLRNPKVAPLCDQAKLLHVASILWTAEHLTDGYIAATSLRQLCDSVPIGQRWQLLRAQQLSEAGLWDPVPEPRGGWVIHDYTVHNKAATRANVERNRELSRQRMETWRGLHVVE